MESTSKYKLTGSQFVLTLGLILGSILLGLILGGANYHNVHNLVQVTINLIVLAGLVFWFVRSVPTIVDWALDCLYDFKASPQGVSPWRAFRFIGFVLVVLVVLRWFSPLSYIWHFMPLSAANYTTWMTAIWASILLGLFTLFCYLCGPSLPKFRSNRKRLPNWNELQQEEAPATSEETKNTGIGGFEFTSA